MLIEQFVLGDYKTVEWLVYNLLILIIILTIIVIIHHHQSKIIEGCGALQGSVFGAFIVSNYQNVLFGQIIYIFYELCCIFPTVYFNNRLILKLFVHAKMSENADC